MTAPAMAVVAWFVASALGGNAFIAAFIAGLAATATFGRVPDAFLTFGEVGGELLGLAVFFMFGVLVPTAGLFDPSVILFAVMALTIVRMGPVALALLGTRLAPATVGLHGLVRTTRTGVHRACHDRPRRRWRPAGLRPDRHRRRRPRRSS